MKYLYILLFVFSLSTIGKGQGFLEGNPQWHIRINEFSPVSPQQVYYSVIYKLGNDTIIDGEEYKEILVTTKNDSSVVRSTGMGIRESNDSIFYKDGHWDEILYFIDKGLEPVYFYEESSHCVFWVEEMDTIENQGILRLVSLMETDPKAFSTELISGVGFSDRMFWSSSCIYDHPWHNIRCHYRNGELVYKVEDGKPCYLEKVVTNTQNEEEAQITIHPVQLLAGESICIRGINKGNYRIMNLEGIIHEQGTIDGETRIVIESRGIIIVNAIGSNGARKSQRIIVH